MPTHTSHYWFVPRRQLFVPRGGKLHDGLLLRRADSAILPGMDQVVEQGHSFSILLKSVHIVDNHDRDNDTHNDLLVRSVVRYGSEPEMELVHFFQPEVPPQAVIQGSEIAAPHVLAKPSHNIDDRVWLNLQVIDVDSRKLKKVAHILRSDRIRAIAQLTGGALFPGTLPFMHSMISDAVPIFKSLQAILGDKDDLILDRRLDFLSQESGETPFRYGAYVFFQDEVEGEPYRLREFTVTSETTAVPGYLVIEVIPEVVSPIIPQEGADPEGVDTGQIGAEQTERDDILVLQRLAAGLRFPDEDDQNPRQQNRRFQYLQRLFKKSAQLDQILGYRQLKHLSQAGVLNPRFSKRLHDLESTASRYLKYIDEILEDE